MRYITSLLLSFFITGLCSFTQTLEPPFVTTDTIDYYPGDHVIISGEGFLPGETVTLFIDHTFFTTHPDLTLLATAKDDGTIYNDEYIVGDNEFNEIYQLTATGLTSNIEVYTWFTDSPRIASVSLSPSSN
jgi:hypothetical protein